MARKKVFRLFSRLNVGGPSIHVVNLSRGLADYNYDTRLIVGRPDKSEGSMEDYALESGVQPFVIDSFQASLSPWRDFLTLVRLTILFRREKPDVVHTHTFKAGLLGRLAAFLSGVPVIVHTYHGHLLHGYAAAWKVRLLVLTERFLGKLSNRLVAVSKKVADDLAASGIAPREKIEVVDLGFDMQRLTEDFAKAATLRTDLGIPPEAQVIGIIGRLVPIKSVELFLQACRSLLEVNPNLYCAIIGDGSERAHLEKLVASFGAVASRVYFTGFRRSVARDLSDLDVVVCSSKNEGTSVSIIEALAAGVPVVSTDVGGMADLLEGGRFGRLVDYDETALRNGIELTLRDLTARKSAQENSSMIRDRFSQERLIRATHELYQRQDT